MSRKVRLSAAEKQKRYREKQKAKAAGVTDAVTVAVTEPPSNAVTREAELEAIARVVEERERLWCDEIEALKASLVDMEQLAILRDSSIKHYEQEVFKLTGWLAEAQQNLSHAVRQPPAPEHNGHNGNGYHFDELLARMQTLESSNQRLARQVQNSKSRHAGSSMRTGSPDALVAASTEQRKKEYNTPVREPNGSPEVVRNSIKRALAELRDR